MISEMAPSIISPAHPAPVTHCIPAGSTKSAARMPHPATKAQGSDDEYKAHSVPFNPQYALNPRKLRIITIGAGFSGLLIAHKFQHRFPELQDFVDHTILEGRSDIGGTWLVNTYPGVQCDVPSHIYVSDGQRVVYLSNLTNRRSHSIRTQNGHISTQAARRFMIISNGQPKSGTLLVMSN